MNKSVVLAREDEAKGIIAHNLTDTTTLPDSIAFSSTGSLNGVNPGPLNIIYGGEKP